MEGQGSFISREHIFGFLAGIAAAGVGFYFYRKNQAKVDSFLAGKGINLPVDTSTETAPGANLIDLVSQKERLEDLIAEREAATKQS